MRLARWQILTYTESALSRVAQLKAPRLNVRLMDLRIAAVALENGAVVVTRNRRDFDRVPRLERRRLVGLRLRGCIRPVP